MNGLSAVPEPEPRQAVDDFEARYGGQSLLLACHAAVAHRLRPELVALIRTNFLRGPARLEPAHDADVLFGPLCRPQGDGFFEMPADIRHYLVRLLDLHDVHPHRTVFPSQKVARFLRHYLDHLSESDSRYRTPRFRRFLTENLWRAIALSDPELARRHIFDHAQARNAHPRQSLEDAPRGSGIISVAGPVLGTLRDDLAYVAAQDLLAEGRAEEGVAVFEAIGDVDFRFLDRKLTAPRAIVEEERMFRIRRENTLASRDGHAELLHGEEGQAAELGEDVLEGGLRVDRSKLELFDTALHEAVRRGDADAVRAALREMPERIDALGEQGLAPLHLAAKAGHDAIAALLIEGGANVDALSALRGTPLFFAAGRGAAAVARRLLDRGADATIRTANNATALMAACYYGHPELVDLLLEAPGVDEAHVNAANDEGFLALTAAVDLGSSRIFARLLAAGAIVPRPRDNSWALLHGAAWGGNAAIAAHLLNEGHRADVTTPDGWTPLHMAAQQGTAAVAELLLECGADPERPQTYGWTPAQIAAHWDAADVLDMLRRHGASMRLAHAGGLSPFHIAAQNGAARALAFFLRLDEIDPDERSADGKDAVALATESNAGAAVEVLLDSGRSRQLDPAALLDAAIGHGADDVVRMLMRRLDSVPEPPAGKPAWVWAPEPAGENRDEVLAALIANPAMPLPDRDGRPLAAELAEEGMARALDALIARGAPLDVADARGQTALGLAAAADRADIVRRLLAAGADPNLASALQAPLLLAGGRSLLELIANGGDAGARAQDGSTPLHLAAARAVPMVPPTATEEVPAAAAYDGAEERALLQAGLDVDATDTLGRTPLHVAAENGNLGRLEILLGHGASIEARSGQGFTPLLSAIAAGQSDAAGFLLERGADARARLGGGWTALHLAAERGLVDLAAHLWQLLDDPDAVAADPPRTALQAAAEAGATGAVERLLELGAVPDGAAFGSPAPVMLAVANGGYAAAAVLLEAGARTDIVHPLSGATLQEVAMGRRRLIELARNFAPVGHAVLDWIITGEAPEPTEDSAEDGELDWATLIRNASEDD